jgi:hypothetical protein
MEHLKERKQVFTQLIGIDCWHSLSNKVCVLYCYAAWRTHKEANKNHNRRLRAIVGWEIGLEKRLPLLVAEELNPTSPLTNRVLYAVDERLAWQNKLRIHSTTRKQLLLFDYLLQSQNDILIKLNANANTKKHKHPSK